MQQSNLDDTNFEPSLKPSKLFEECKQINVDNLYNILHVQTKRQKKVNTQSNSRGSELTQGIYAKANKVYQTQSIQSRQFMVKPGMKSMKSKDASMEQMKQDASLSSKDKAVSPVDLKQINDKRNSLAVQSNRIHKTAEANREKQSSGSKRPFTNMDHRYHLSRPYRQPTARNHNPHIQSISEMEARIIGDERQHRYLQYALNNSKTRTGRTSRYGRRGQPHLTLMLNNQTSTDQLDGAPRYNIVIQNQSSKVLLVNSQFNKAQSKEDVREEVNATQVQEDVRINNQYHHQSQSSAKIMQLQSIPNYTKSQVLNFDNITMREEITPKQARSGKSAGNLNSLKRAEDISAKENADLVQSDAKNQRLTKKTKSGRSIVIQKDNRDGSVTKGKDGQVDLNPKIKIFQNRKSILDSNKIQSGKDDQNEMDLLIPDPHDDSTPHDSRDQKNQKQMNKVTTLVLEQSTSVHQNKTIRGFKLNQNDQKSTIHHEQDQDITASPDISPTMLSETHQDQAAALAAATDLTQVIVGHGEDVADHDEDRVQRPEEIRRDILEIDKRQRAATTKHVHKFKMTFKHLVSEFVKKPIVSEPSTSKNEAQNQRSRYQRNMRSQNFQQRSTVGKTIIKDPDYKFKYACKDLHTFKKKKLGQDAIERIISDSYHPLEHRSSIKSKVEDAMRFSRRRQPFILRSYQQRAQHFNPFGALDHKLNSPPRIQTDSFHETATVEEPDHEKYTMNSQKFKSGVQKVKREHIVTQNIASDDGSKMAMPDLYFSDDLKKSLQKESTNQQPDEHEVSKENLRNGNPMMGQTSSSFDNRSKEAVPQTQENSIPSDPIGTTIRDQQESRQASAANELNLNLKSLPIFVLDNKDGTNADGIAEEQDEVKQMEEKQQQIQEATLVSIMRTNNQFSLKKFGGEDTEEFTVISEEGNDSSALRNVSEKKRMMRECQRLAPKTASNFFQGVRSGSISGCVSNTRDVAVSQQDQRPYRKDHRLIKKVQSQNVNSYKGGNSKISSRHQKRSGYYSPHASYQDDTARDATSQSRLDQPGIAQSISVSYRNFKHQTGYGVLYQNRNQELRIGDIQGVKGDPAQNITQKGIFENSGSQAFDLQSSHVNMFNKKELQIMKSHYQRAQKKYAQGAVMSPSLVDIDPQIHQRPFQTQITSPIQKEQLFKFTRLKSSENWKSGVPSMPAAPTSVTSGQSEPEVLEQRRRLVHIRSMRSSNRYGAIEGGYKTMSQRYQDENAMKLQQQPYQLQSAEVDGFGLPMHFATENEYPVMQQDDSKVNLVQEPALNGQKSTIDRISADRVVQGSVHISKIQKANDGNGDTQLNEPQIIDKSVHLNFKDASDNDELPSARFQGISYDEVDMKGRRDDVVDLDRVKELKQVDEFTRQETAYDYWNKQQQIFQAQLEQERFSIFRKQIHSNINDLVIDQNYSKFHREYTQPVEVLQPAPGATRSKSRQSGNTVATGAFEASPDLRAVKEKKATVGLAANSFCGFKVPKFSDAEEQMRKKKLMMSSQHAKEALGSHANAHGQHRQAKQHSKRTSNQPSDSYASSAFATRNAKRMASETGGDVGVYGFESQKVYGSGESIQNPAQNASNVRRYVGHPTKRINHYNWRMTRKRAAASDKIGPDPIISNSNQAPLRESRQILSEKAAHVSTYQDDMAASSMNNKDRKSSTSQRRSIYNLFSKSNDGLNSGLQSRRMTTTNNNNLLENKSLNEKILTQNSMKQNTKVEPISPISVTVQGQMNQEPYQTGDYKIDMADQQSVQTSKLETSKFD